ncbi:hypothetical protein SLA2020_006620 [Shorea laevis]
MNSLFAHLNCHLSRLLVQENIHRNAAQLGASYSNDHVHTGGKLCCCLLWKKRQTAVQSSILEVGNLLFHAALAASTTALAAACWLSALHTMDTTCSLLSISHT